MRWYVVVGRCCCGFELTTGEVEPTEDPALAELPVALEEADDTAEDSLDDTAEDSLDEVDEAGGVSVIAVSGCSLTSIL